MKPEGDLHYNRLVIIGKEFFCMLYEGCSHTGNSLMTGLEGSCGVEEEEANDLHNDTDVLLQMHPCCLGGYMNTLVMHVCVKIVYCVVIVVLHFC